MCGSFKHSHGIRASIGLTSHDPNSLQLIWFFSHPSSLQHHDSHGYNQALLLQLSSMEESTSSSSWKSRLTGSCGWHPCAATTIWSSHLLDTKQQSPSMESNWPASASPHPMRSRPPWKTPSATAPRPVKIVSKMTFNWWSVALV